MTRGEVPTEPLAGAQSSILIQGSEFTELNFGTEVEDQLPLTTAASSLRHQGIVMSLESFSGEIRLISNSFSENWFKFGSCFDDVDFSTTLAEPFYEDNFSYTYKKASE
mmetsp:Transcript_25293/g.39116  ORF Transcript_25293/g.39116 Transcript_25293/m.39116 type:complete len:109 (+) Transcript_25293:1422-1748(+)